MAVLRPTRRGERGAVAVEAALVIPVIMLLVFGMIDMSLMLRDYVSLTAATRSATRLAAAEADAGPCAANPGDTTLCMSGQATLIPEAAQDAADTAQKSLTGVSGDSVQYMLVFEANTKGFPCVNVANCNPALTASPDTNTTMPSSCIGYANCDMFTWIPAKSAFRYYAAGSTGWDSKTIAACLNKEDSIGVFIKVNHQWLTGVLGAGAFPISDKSVMKFEPLPSDTCDSTKPNKHP